MARQDAERTDLRKQIGSLRTRIRDTLPDGTDLYHHALSLMEQRPRLTWALDRLVALYQQLQNLWKDIVQWFNDHDAEEADDHENCRRGRNELQTLIQDYNTSESFCKKAEVREDTPRTNILPPDQRQTEAKVWHNRTVSLADVMQLIKIPYNGQMYQMVRGQPINVSGLAEAAEKNCALLGISVHAWQEACRIMGTQTASACVASIEAKGARVHNPGGYLRGMTAKAIQGKLDLAKTVRGLCRS